MRYEDYELSTAEHFSPPNIFWSRFILHNVSAACFRSQEKISCCAEYLWWTWLPAGYQYFQGEWVVQNHFVHLTVALYSNKYTKATNCGCKTILKCLILHILMFFEDFVTFIFSLIHRWFLTFFVHWSPCWWASKLTYLLLQYHRFSSLLSIVFIDKLENL